MSAQRGRTWGALALGVCLGAGGFALVSCGQGPGNAGTSQPAPDLAAVTADIQMIKDRLPDQSHAMQDVSYHFTNLWFAAEAKHWKLADFYYSETKSHLHWAVRIKPVRKDSADKEIDLVKILEAVENTPLKALGEAIAAQDSEAFQKQYRATLEGCYSCHKASDKPYLHPQVPTHPEVQIVNFDPNPDWPK